MARLKAAPPWDLVVFDEAHHLSAYRQNGKLVKTQNFKLAEMLKEHTRDLVLLSATPHQKRPLSLLDAGADA
jgi:superfamily II DNA or RNA helicase